MNNRYRAVIIACYSEMPVMDIQDLRQDEDLEFDYINDKTVNSDANITSSPTINGDYIADHMYRNPITIQLSGTFSLDGYKGTVYSNSSDRLSSIQKTFEEIQAKGIKCKIVTRKDNNNDDVRFVTRDNMYLKSISWTERVNSVEFSFTFEEAITVTIDDLPFVPSNVVDESIPAITQPLSTNVLSSVIDLSELSSLVDDVCKQTGIMTNDFANMWATLSAGSTLTVLGGVTAGLGVAAIASAGAISAIPGGIVVVGLAAVGFGIYSLFNYFSELAEANKYRVEQFKLYQDDVNKTQAELERYQAFKSQIIEQLQIAFDEIEVYDITTDQNQECLISIDDDYWNFKFIRDNNTNCYSLTVENMTIDNVFPQQSLSTITNLFDCNENNVLLRTDRHNYHVYIMCPILATLNEPYDSETYQQAIQNLRNYKILVMKRLNPAKFKDTLIEIIRNAILK